MCAHIHIYVYIYIYVYVCEYIHAYDRGQAARTQLTTHVSGDAKFVDSILIGRIPIYNPCLHHCISQCRIAYNNIKRNHNCMLIISCRRQLGWRAIRMHGWPNMNATMAAFHDSASSFHLCDLVPPFVAKASIAQW